MQKVTPHIWCQRNAEEVGTFYASIFVGAQVAVESRYPQSGLLDFQESFAGEPLTVTVDIAGHRLTLINAGEEFSATPSISLMLNFDPLLWEGGEAEARKRQDDIWSALSAGGTVLMPLGEYPFSPRYGWVQDRYGVSWQLILTDPAGDPRPFVMPTLLFGGSAQNRAREAVDFYLRVFEESQLGQRRFYPEAQGPVTSESVLFSDFRIGDQWFVAMDSGVEQPFDFTPGVSLEVKCRGQAEIDHLWESLSAVPEAEQCGWLVDRFGVSWQIVPENMAELLSGPGSFERMLQMKKIVITDL